MKRRKAKKLLNRVLQNMYDHLIAGYDSYPPMIPLWQQDRLFADNWEYIQRNKWSIRIEEFIGPQACDDVDPNLSWDEWTSYLRQKYGKYYI